MGQALSYLDNITPYSFTVKKAQDLSLSMEIGTLANGIYPVTITMQNKGFYPFNGKIKYGGEGYEQEEELILQADENPIIKQYEYHCDFALHSTEKLTASLIQNEEILASVTKQIEIPQAAFTLSSYPLNAIYNIKEVAPFIVKVKNTGGVGGQVEVKLNAGELQESEQVIYLQAGQEQELDFSFLVPDELASGDYVASITLNGQRSDIPFKINGYKIDVKGALDKTLYQTADTIRLTLDITDINGNANNLPLSVLGRYGEEEQTQQVTLSGTNQVLFNFPVQNITNNFIHVSVNHLSGESIYIKTFNINLLDGILSLTSDKQDYNVGDTVTLKAVTEQTSGPLTVVIENILNQTIEISQTQELNFILPLDMVSGRYNVYYTFNGETKIYSIDVHGFEAVVKNSVIENKKYSPKDTIHLQFQIYASEDAQNLIFKSEIKNMFGTYYPEFQSLFNVTKGYNLINLTIPVEVATAGIHQLCYAIFKTTSRGNEIVNNGNISFDVGTAYISSLTSTEDSYKAGSPIELKTTLIGSGAGKLKVYLDAIEEPVFEQDITIEGSQEVTLPLDPITKIGTHDIRVIFDDGLIGERNLSLSITDGTPPVSEMALSGNYYASNNSTIYVTDQTQIELKARDNSSGISCIEYHLNNEQTWQNYTTPIQLTNSGENSILVRSTDNNTNTEEEKDFSFFMDNKAPETSISSSQVDNRITIQITASDEGSGISSTSYKLDGGDIQYGSTLMVSEQGSHIIEYWSTDNLGLEEIHKVYTFTLDTDAPLTTHNYANSGLWNKEDVNIILSAQDNISGVKATYFQIDEGAIQIGNTFAIQTEGKHTITFWSEDNSGNVEEKRQIEVLLDKSMPELNVQSPIEGMILKAGDQVNIQYAVSDEISGVKEVHVLKNGTLDITDQNSFISEINDQSLVFQVIDNANNIKEKTIPLLVDGKAPVTGTNYSLNGQWTNKDVSITLIPLDDKSGIKATYFQIDSGVIQPGMIVNIAQEGIHTLSYWSEDKAGNVENKNILEIKIDKSLPNLNILSPVESKIYKAGETILIQYDGTDTLSGIKQTQVFKNETEDISDQSSFVTDETDLSLKIITKDNAENSIEKTVSFKVDGQKPVTTHNYSNIGKWINADPTIQLSASDNLSGVSNTYYQIDNNPVQTGTSFTITIEGVHTISYWSEDTVGNVEDKKTFEVKLDKSYPSLTIQSPIDGTVYKTGDTISINYTAVDSLSGISETKVYRNGSEDISGQSSITAQSSDTYLLFKSKDNAGNEISQRVNFNVTSSSLVQVGLRIEPRVLVKKWGVITAFIWLPDKYKAGDVISLECDGAKPLLLLKEPRKGKLVTAFFNVNDIKNLDVYFTVKGKFKNGKEFEGKDTIKAVIDWNKHHKHPKEDCKKGKGDKR